MINRLKETLISILKNNSVITDLLPSSDEIRELNWKGTNFEYPNIRVQVESVSLDDTGCFANYTASISVFSEKASSEQCDTICGTIMSEINNTRRIVSGTAISMRVVSIIPARAENDVLWRSQLTINGIMTI